MSVAAVDTIEPQSEPAHIELPFREMLYARAVVDMSQDFVREGGLQFLRSLQEPVVLQLGEMVEVVGVGAHEMREHRPGQYRVLSFQSLYELIHILFRVESQAVHSGVDLQVHGIIVDALFPGRGHQSVEQPETIHLGLQFVIEDGLERRHLRIHHHDIARDAILSQGDALVGHRHRQVVHLMVLQRLGYLHGACPIGIGLDHAHYLRRRLEEGFVMIEIGHQGVEVDLEDSLVNFLHKPLGESVEIEVASALEKNHLVGEGLEHRTRHKLVGIIEESLFSDLYLAGLGRNLRTDADKPLHPPAQGQRRHLLVQFLGGHSALMDVAEDECTLPSLVVGPAVHEIEGDVE